MSSLREFIDSHPQIASWVVLAVGMVIILGWSAKDVGFNPAQWTALIITTVLLAGACVWIIGWGEADEEEQGDEAGQEG